MTPRAGRAALAGVLLLLLAAAARSGEVLPAGRERRAGHATRAGRSTAAGATGRAGVPAPRRASTAAWLDGVNVFHWKGDTELPFSGLLWGFAPYPQEELDLLTFDVGWWHERGKPYLGSMEFGNDWLGAPVAPEDAALDVNGRPLTSWSGELMPALHNPAWRQRLLGWLEAAIDAGVDGLTIDGYWQNATLVVDQGGSFDPWAMVDFREYLRGKYDKAELGALGIDDIDSFDYREWIVARGEQETWNETPLEGLAAEFYLYEWQYANDFLAEFQQHAQEYARANYDRDFFLTDNNAGGLFHSAELSDLLVGEFFYYHWAPASSDYAASDIKMRRGVAGVPVVVLPEIGISRTVRPPDQTRNLIRFVLADIYAAGGAALFHEDSLLRIDTRKGQYKDDLALDTTVVRTYNTFILGHPELYENLEPLAQVAVVYSAASQMNADVALEDGDSANTAHPWGYAGVSKVLLRANVQHDAVYLADPRFAKDRLKKKTLARYDCIIVPNAYALSDKQVKKLLAYARKGGVLLLTDGAGRWDENGRLGNRKAWETLLQEGTHQVRRGEVIYTPDPVGAWYEADEGDTERDFILDTVGRYADPLTVVQGAEGVFAYLYRGSDPGERVIHLFNTNYAPNADAFTPTGAFTLSVTADRGDYTATLLSPDLPGETPLTARWKKGRVQIRLPSIEAYAVVQLTPR